MSGVLESASFQETEFTGDLVWATCVLATEAFGGNDIATSAIIQIRQDVDRVVTLSKTQNWVDNTPVNQEVFGPLWPQGEPIGWQPKTV